MKEDNQFIQKHTNLRQEAEAQLDNDLSELTIPTTQVETATLIRELRLRQIELEMQNEELRQLNSLGLSTECKQVHQTLLESEAKYRNIFENMLDVYYETGIDGEILEISPSVLAFSEEQYNREDLIGRSINEFYTYPEERIKVLEIIYKQGFVADYELSMTNKDGSRIPVAISSKVAFDAKGHPVKILGSLRDITNRKQSEAKVKESEANIQAIIENSFENVWSINTNYEIQYVNQQFVREFEKTFGVKLVKKVNILDALPEPQKTLWKERYDKALNNEHFVFTDKIDLGNTVIYIEVAMNPIVIDGKVTGVSLHGKDITERKNAELALRNSEAQFREFFEKSADAIFIAEIESGIIIDANEAASRLMLMQHDQIVGLNQAQLHSPITEIYAKETFAKHREIVKQNGASLPLENSVLRSDGLLVPVEILAAKVTFQGRHFLMGTFRDITVRKQMETELIAAKENAERSEQQLMIKNKELIERNSFIQTVLDNLPIGIALNKIDEGTATYMNKKFEEIYGWSADDIISIGSFFECVYPDADYRNNLMTQIMHDIQSGNPEQMHWENILVTRKDGSKRVVNAVNIPLMEQNTMVSTVADITELHKTQNDLLAAKEKAEENDRLKSAFLANMSHEIRTPLNSIIGFSELMSNPDFDQHQQHEFAKMIHVSGCNLLSIISDIMDLSKIEAGQVQVKKEIFSGSQLIRDIQREYSLKANQKGIELRIEQSVDQMEIFLESDESKLRQILINFVGNALKFTDSGFIELGVKITGEFYFFHVKDTGIGISREYQDTIFERFRQVETAHTRKYGGNGLGLAISKSLVELLGGKIWMESEKGKGSVFYFELPMKN